jgi:hypothetical protein
MGDVQELSFVRTSMRALAAARTGCAQCGRTPLVGETIFFYDERMVCELCRRLRADEPARAEVVHSAEHELTVRARRRRYSPRPEWTPSPPMS